MITVNLTVYREANGTLHLPVGSLLPVAVNCNPEGVNYLLDAILEVVLVKPEGVVLVEQTTFTPGTFVVTKITNACDGTYVYVKENKYDVIALQNPCCSKIDNPACPIATVVAAQTSLNIAWSIGDNQYGWHIEFYSDAAVTNIIKTSDTNNPNVTSDSIINLTANTTYYFRISAKDSSYVTIAGCPIQSAKTLS